jgi:hypothetical protein
MTQIVKIQHYVPRLYLRNFSVVNKGKCSLFCFDKVKEKVFSVRIENIASEKYFYDTDKGKNQIVERMLGRLESIFNAAYSKLLRTEDIGSLSLRERAAIAYFVAIQDLRTREFREFFKDMAKQLKEKLSGYKMTEGFKKQLETMQGEKAAKAMQLKFMVSNADWYAKIVAAMKWMLLVNETKLPFWTSDQPINRHNDIDQSPYGNLGLLSKGIQIYFPLSTKISLLFCDPILFKMLPKKVSVKEENVIFQNCLQVSWSTKHIFSTNNGFDLAKKMIVEHPELKDVARHRLSVL